VRDGSDVEAQRLFLLDGTRLGPWSLRDSWADFRFTKPGLGGARANAADAGPAPSENLLTTTVLIKTNCHASVVAGTQQPMAPITGASQPIIGLSRRVLHIPSNFFLWTLDSKRNNSRSGGTLRLHQHTDGQLCHPETRTCFAVEYRLSRGRSFQAGGALNSTTQEAAASELWSRVAGTDSFSIIYVQFPIAFLGDASPSISQSKYGGGALQTPGGGPAHTFSRTRDFQLFSALA